MPRILLLTSTTSYRARDFLAAAASLEVDVVVGSDHRQVLERYSAGRSLYVNLAKPEQAGRSTPIGVPLYNDNVAVAPSIR